MVPAARPDRLPKPAVDRRRISGACRFRPDIRVGHPFLQRHVRDLLLYARTRLYFHFSVGCHKRRAGRDEIYDLLLLVRILDALPWLWSAGHRFGCMQIMFGVFDLLKFSLKPFRPRYCPVDCTPLMLSFR